VPSPCIVRVTGFTVTLTNSADPNTHSPEGFPWENSAHFDRRLHCIK
jgi:hypothetical protein